MYSGTTLRTKSGRIVGVHQRIDRLAYRYVRRKTGWSQFFPRLQSILHFEGRNGPDGIKQKHPARDEPWHFIDPNKIEDSAIIEMIRSHQHNLTKAIKAEDENRAAFEASWLAHAITDGLTPAHHYPFESKLNELRGEGIETRTSFFKKNIMPGKTIRKKLLNNWDYWGAKGVMTTHFLFEYGIAMAIVGRKFESALPADEVLEKLLSQPIEEVFTEALKEVDSLGMYEIFYRQGWTRNLTQQTNKVLMPTIIRTVLVAWLQSVEKAREA